MYCQALQGFDLSDHAGRVTLVRILLEFADCELHSFLGGGEIGKQIGELRNRQELVLCNTRVLVHWLSYDCEIDWRLQETLVFFLMAVTEEQHLKQLTEKVSFLLVWQCLQEAGLLVLQVLYNELHNGLLVSFGATHVVVRFECSFKVDSHCAETCPFVIEVKFLVLHRLLLGGLIV